MTTDTAAIRAQMEALREAGQYMLRVVDHLREWHRDDPDDRINLMVKDGCAVSSENMARAVLAAAPDMHATILALCDTVDRLNAAIVRQAGAAKTLRESTLAEVQYLKDQDRSEYHAAASLDSERKANEILTDESDKLRAENELLRTALTKIKVGDGWAAQIAHAALAALETDQ